MTAKSYTVKEVAALARVTVRTLHHYDSVGLLVPQRRSSAGYRLYGDEDLLRLQQILLWRQLGLALEQIRTILDDPSFDRHRALLEQRQQLRERASETDRMLRSIDLAIQALEEGRQMDAKQLFDGFDASKYDAEAKARWGNTDAYKIAAQRTKAYKRQDWDRMKAEADDILRGLAEKLTSGLADESAEVIDLAERHRLHIDRWFYPCSRAMHAQLAEMYVADERFAASFERYAKGLAEFLADAIRANLTRDE